MKVAIAGTAGLARSIGSAALAEGHEVLLLSRTEQASLGPLRVRRVDYSRPASLHTALVGVDTVVSTVTNAEAQLALIDACLTARVRRFAPAEFEGPPAVRPMVGVALGAGGAGGAGGADDKMAVLGRLREEAHRLESAVFCCGLLYERFHPRGLAAVCSPLGPAKDEGDFLVSVRDAKAVVPAGPAAACFTAAADVARFVARALALAAWPERLACCGQRLRLADIVRLAEQATGRPFETAEADWDMLHDQLSAAEAANDLPGVLRIDLLLATQRGEFDFETANLNAMFPDIETVKLKDWLEAVWKDEELD